MPGVTVTYDTKKGKKGTVSDEKGFYEMAIPAGGVHLTFNFMGYKPEPVPLVLNPRETMTKNIYLRTEDKLLDAAVVTAGRFEQKMSDLTVSMDVLKSDQVLKQDPGDITATLKTVPGVDVVDRQPSIRGGNGWVYGVGSRTMILVDGQSALDPGSGQINWNTIPMEDIAQIEVLKGASSVLYGSSALNGVINIRTNRPGLTPRTNASAYLGIYGTPQESGYEWRDKGFYEDNDAPVEPFLRRNILAGVRQPLYTGLDFSHSRRIGNFDVSGGINLFADEGYREAGYNRRIRVGGNVTYHQPGKNIVNYGANVNFLSYKNGDFFVWRSPYQAYRSSQFTNMGREGNQFKLSPFYNYTDTDRDFSHKVNARFFYSADHQTAPHAFPAGYSKQYGNGCLRPFRNSRKSGRRRLPRSGMADPRTGYPLPFTGRSGGSHKRYSERRPKLFKHPVPQRHDSRLQRPDHLGNECHAGPRNRSDDQPPRRQ